jgi:hypothetical protein
VYSSFLSPFLHYCRGPEFVLSKSHYKAEPVLFKPSVLIEVVCGFSDQIARKSKFILELCIRISELSTFFSFFRPAVYAPAFSRILARLIFGGFGHKHDHPYNGHPFHHPFKKWHDRVHGREEAEPRPSGSDHRKADTAHYQAFWEKEGRRAFEDYLKNMEEGD